MTSPARPTDSHGSGNAVQEGLLRSRDGMTLADARARDCQAQLHLLSGRMAHLVRRREATAAWLRRLSTVLDLLPGAILFHAIVGTAVYWFAGGTPAYALAAVTLGPVLGFMLLIPVERSFGGRSEALAAEMAVVEAEARGHSDCRVPAASRPGGPRTRR